jgi:hypothetical protein
MTIYDNEQPIDPFAHQIRRMSPMRDYPTGDDGEWIEIARKFSPCGACGFSFLIHSPSSDCQTFTADHLSNAVSQLIEECIKVPSCAELKAALVARIPDREPAWAKEPPPQRSGESAWQTFAKQNEAIMVRAREAEKERAEKDRRVKELLGIHDFMVVDWPQRFWAARELGYPMTALQDEEINQWLSVTREPRKVIGARGSNAATEVPAMFGMETA